MNRISFILLSLLFILLALGGCRTEESEEDGIIGTGVSSNDDGALLRGSAQKGPFVLGSKVTVNLLTSAGQPTVQTLVTETEDDLGNFSFSIQKSNPVQIIVEGFHFNEISGQLSNGTMTLQSIYQANANNTQKLTVNVMTHLIHKRILKLVQSGVRFDDAIQQAESEWINTFQSVLPIESLNGFSELSLYGETSDEATGDAYLLALSATLYQYAMDLAVERGESSEALLTQTLNTLAEDLSKNGRIDAAEMLPRLLTASRSIHPGQVMNNLRVRANETLQTPLPVADLNRFIDTDGDGQVNHLDTDDDNDGIEDSLDVTPYGDVGFSGSGQAAPEAKAGADRTEATGTEVHLDGGGSTSPSGASLTYTWSFTSLPEGSNAVLSNAFSASPQFVTDVRGSYTIRLNVYDGVSEAVDTITIIANDAPVIQAGMDRIVGLSDTVILDGSPTSDTEGDTLSFLWTLVEAPIGSSATLNDATTANASFVADVFGVFRLSLKVSDGISEAETTITVTANTDPIVEAGQDRSVSVNAPVTLNGEASRDPDANSLSYQWEFLSVPTNSVATLSEVSSATPSFTPDQEGAYSIQLTVNDGVVERSDTVVILATKPIVKIEGGGSVSVNATVLLNGSASSDPEGDALTYLWELSSKPEGSLSVLNNPTQASTLFIPDEAGPYEVNLTISDSFSESKATVVFNASTPIAIAVENTNDGDSSIISLDGSGSSDPQGDSLDYTWQIISKPENSIATITNDRSATPTFSPDQVGTYTFVLIVSDGYSVSSDTLSVSAEVSWDSTPVQEIWSARAKTTSLVFDNKLWIFGGGNPDDAVSAPNNDVWSSSDGSTWTRVLESAPWAKRYGHVSVVFDGKMWVMGGYGGFNGSFVYFNDVWSSSDGVNWTEVTSTAEWTPRSSFSGVVFDNQIWILGGCTSLLNCSSSEVWSSQDGSTWTQNASSVTWGPNYPSVVFNGKLWGMGAVLYEKKIRSSDDGITWVEHSVPWSGRTGHVGVIFNNKIWVIGGKDSNQTNLKDVWYSGDGINWVQALDAPWSERSLHTGAVFSGKIWIMGGQGSSLFQDIWASK